MRTIPVDIIERYEAMLEKQEISLELGSYYKKWLRYFLDYCEKYPSAGGNTEYTAPQRFEWVMV